jgi:hypothetical protein
VTFESNSKLLRIEEYAFSGCLSLSAISIPASVGILRAHCFNQCSSLSSVTFEQGSKLSRIETNAFVGCSALGSLSILSPIDQFPADCFNGCSRLSITQINSDSTLHSEEGAAPNAVRPDDSASQSGHIGEDQ